MSETKLLYDGDNQFYIINNYISSISILFGLFI